MKMKILYIVCFLLCVSCNQYTSKKEENAVKSEEFNVDKSNLLEIDDENTIEIDFSLDGINSEIEEKLQANYEAKVLAMKHPEFQEAIQEQLANSNKFDVTLSDSIETIEIRDILFLDDLRNQNDSISTQKVLYTYIVNSKYIQRDSVLVVIKRNMIVIDNSVKMNTSFSFEKLD